MAGALKAMERADSFLTSLMITTNSMQETGMIEKLKQKNFRELQPSEVSAVLMALMNTPVGRQLFPTAAGHHDSAKPDPEDE